MIIGAERIGTECKEFLCLRGLDKLQCSFHVVLISDVDSAYDHKKICEKIKIGIEIGRAHV